VSKKWLEKEGQRWIDQQIISQDQYGKIMSLYDDKKAAIGLLPLFGGLLLGLGVLSFIAANWQDIQELYRLGLIIAAMCGFYAAGESLQAKGHEKLGIALIGVGLMTFGAGIVLVGQMFHLFSTNGLSMIVWGIAGTLLTYIYRSRYLYILSLIIFQIAQIYAAAQFHSFSYPALVIMAAGLGWYAWKRANTLVTMLFSLGLAVQGFILILTKEWAAAWLLVPLLLLYGAGDWIRSRSQSAAMQLAPLVGSYLFAIFMVLFIDDGDVYWQDDIRADAYFFLPILIVLLALSAFGKLRLKRETSSPDWLVFLPLFYSPGGVGVLYLIAMLLFSLYVLWRGYSEEWRMKINLGTLLFIFTAMIAYFKLTWSFMDKSLFFIIGGILLLLLSWLLNRRRRSFIAGEKGE
jgi:uncharacterized membrane protein